MNDADLGLDMKVGGRSVVNCRPPPRPVRGVQLLLSSSQLCPCRDVGLGIAHSHFLREARNQDSFYVGNEFKIFKNTVQAKQNMSAG